MTRVDWVILAAVWGAALLGRFPKRLTDLLIALAVVSVMFVFFAEALA